MQLTGNTATVTSDASYTISAWVSAWAQPTFMLLAVCDGVLAIVDAAPPSFLAPGCLLPPPAFTMPVLALPAIPLTFDAVAFPAAVAEGVTFGMRVTLPAAGLPASVTLQGVVCGVCCTVHSFPPSLPPFERCARF